MHRRASHAQFGAAEPGAFVTYALFCRVLRAFSRLREVLARALRAHPHTPAFYVMAGTHTHAVTQSRC